MIYILTSVSFRLTIEVPSGFHAPSFDHPLTDIRCDEKEILKLDVKIEANPAPEIFWYRNNTEILHGNRHRLQYDDGDGHYSLTIMDAYKEDSGEYK